MLACYYVTQPPLVFLLSLVRETPPSLPPRPAELPPLPCCVLREGRQVTFSLLGGGRGWEGAGVPAAAPSLERLLASLPPPQPIKGADKGREHLPGRKAEAERPRGLGRCAGRRKGNALAGWNLSDPVSLWPERRSLVKVNDPGEEEEEEEGLKKTPPPSDLGERISVRGREGRRERGRGRLFWKGGGLEGGGSSSPAPFSPPFP